MFANPAASPRPRRRPASVSPQTGRARAPRYARFLQADPIGYADGMSLYVYGRGDPVNRSDPSGMYVYCTGSIIPRGGCDDGQVNFLRVNWVNLPAAPPSAPEGPGAAGSATGTISPNTGMGASGSASFSGGDFGGLLGGGHELAHVGGGNLDNVLIVTGVRRANPRVGLDDGGGGQGLQVSFFTAQTGSRTRTPVQERRRRYEQCRSGVSTWVYALAPIGGIWGGLEAAGVLGGTPAPLSVRSRRIGVGIGFSGSFGLALAIYFAEAERARLVEQICGRP
jgi:hypothetical protein